MMLKKVLSVFLAVVMAFSTFTAVNAFASEGRNVVTSGVCGAEGDNLKWSLYDDGELVISGSGEMDWYYPFESDELARFPSWYENREIVKIVTMEDGVTSIGSYAFYNMPNLHRINIPVSLEFYEDDLFHTTQLLMVWGAQLAVCYPADGKIWAEIERKNEKWLFNQETGTYDRVTDGTLPLEITEEKPENEDVKLYLNGEEPQIFCRITGDEKLGLIKGRDTVSLIAEYYFAGREDLNLKWGFENMGGSLSVAENKADIKQIANLTDLYSAHGEGNVILSVVTEDGKVLATDKSDVLRVEKEEPVEQEEDVSPIGMFFAGIGGFFFEIFLLFSYGFIFLASIISMPFYALGDLFNIG
ncbi:MAG: leucine-rich repeat protein [Clostridia bacterium]|nr:leucine-rich repeat protein [Clostridia bacterium]